MSWQNISYCLTVVPYYFVSTSIYRKSWYRLIDRVNWNLIWFDLTSPMLESNDQLESYTVPVADISSMPSGTAKCGHEIVRHEDVEFWWNLFHTCARWAYALVNNERCSVQMKSFDRLHLSIDRQSQTLRQLEHMTIQKNPEVFDLLT